MSPLATLVARFDDACRALGYSDDLSLFGRPHPVLHFDTGLGRETLWHRAAATTDCINFGVSMKPLPRGALPRAAYPLAKLARAAKRAMGVAVKHVHYDANQGHFLGTSLVEGDGVPEWRVWAPGLPDLETKGYASELEALIAVLEEAARTKAKPGDQRGAPGTDAPPDCDDCGGRS
jgi:hypothetical protein